MSYRELRNLTEMMRALGYPRPISIENFRKPNFELVSDMAFWMVKKYDPSCRISEDIDTERERVESITQVVVEVFQKARIRLNPKKLYASDGCAVKELLKLAKVLYEASRIETTGSTGGGSTGGTSGSGSTSTSATAPANAAVVDEDEDDVSIKSLLASRVKDPKVMRQLSSDITQSGAKLYDLLQNELEIRDIRMQALTFLEGFSSSAENSNEQKFLERSIKQLLEQMQETIETTERQCVELEAEEKAIGAKMKKAQQDLERNDKRLKSLHNVRPAFMDEYEKLEKELERQYSIYCERFRNLDFLQRELDLHNSRELKKLAENDRSLKKLQKKFRDDELAILRGEQEDPIDNMLGGGNNSNTNNDGSSSNNEAKLNYSGSSTTNARKSSGSQNSQSQAGSSSSGKATATASSKHQANHKAKTASGAKKTSTSKVQRGDSESGSDEDASSDEEAGAGNAPATRVAAEASESGSGSGSESDEVSLADSAELIDNDDEETGSEEGSEHSKSGSEHNSGSGNSDTDQDF